MICPGPGRRRRASPRRENPGHLAFLQPRHAAPIKSMSVGPLSCSRHGPSPSQVPPAHLQTCSHIPEGAHGRQRSPAQRDTFMLPSHPKNERLARTATPAGWQRRRWKRHLQFPSDTNSWQRVREFSHAREQQVPKRTQPPQSRCPTCLQLPSWW